MLQEGEVYFNANRSLSLNLYLENYPSIPITNEEYEMFNSIRPNCKLNSDTLKFNCE